MLWEYAKLKYDKKIGDYDFLQSYISHNGKKYDFKNTNVCPLSVAGDGEGIRIQGEIHLPKEISSGNNIDLCFKLNI